MFKCLRQNLNGEVNEIFWFFQSEPANVKKRHSLSIRQLLHFIYRTFDIGTPHTLLRQCHRPWLKNWALKSQRGGRWWPSIYLWPCLRFRVNPRPLINHPDDNDRRTLVIHMSFSFWLLTFESGDSSQVKKDITDCKGEEINKMTTIFTQKRQLRTILSENSCHFVNFQAL